MAIADEDRAELAARRDAFDDNTKFVSHHGDRFCDSAVGFFHTYTIAVRSIRFKQTSKTIGRDIGSHPTSGDS